MALKLIKHEFKNSWLEITIICPAIIIVSLIFSLSVSIQGESYLVAIMSILTLSLLYIAAVSLVIINIVRSINKKLFSNEGYLTLTLPVSVDQLILTKVFVNFIWIVVTFITFFVSLLLIGSTLGADAFSSVASYVYEHPLIVLLAIIFTSIEALVFIVSLILVLGLLNTGRIKKLKLLVGIILYYLIVNVLTWIKTFIQIIPYSIVEIGRAHV